MTALAMRPLLRRSAEPQGIYQVCAVQGTDYPIAIPDDAIGCVVWFETSAASATKVVGRVGIADNNTLITGLTGSDDNMAYTPDQAVQFEVVAGADVDTYLHVAVSAPIAANAVVKGMWLYGHENT